MFVSRGVALGLLLTTVLGSLHAVGLDASRNRRGNAWSVSEGKIVNKKYAATMEVNDHFDLGVQFIEEENWREAVMQFQVITSNFADTPYGQDAYYYLGVANFFIEEFDASNTAFNEYLKGMQTPKYFEQAIEYKYCIADRFSRGAKRRPFHSKQMPKWVSAYDMAIDVYDEVITAMPSHDLAAKSYYSKARVHWLLKEYHEAVESFQMLARRFPKHELAPECYLNITRVYLDQCRQEFQNPDLIAFAELNVRKFKEMFPRELRLEEAEADVMKIKEVYAQGFYETGQFYERTENPVASVIYYRNALTQFPETQVAKWCRQRLEVLAPGVNYPSNASPGEDFDYQTDEQDYNDA